MLTARFNEALALALELHSGQKRKGTGVPYASHLLAVASLVLETGGDEESAIAALLHDAVEDCGGRPVLDAIRARFGARVAHIVDGCTDAYVSPKPPWKERKLQYLEHLGTEADEAVLLVANADKLHNARSVLRDYRAIGEKLWGRFTASRDETLWYYREVSELLARRRPSVLSDELRRVVADLEDLVGGRRV